MTAAHLRLLVMLLAGAVTIGAFWALLTVLLTPLLGHPLLISTVGPGINGGLFHVWLLDRFRDVRP